MKELGAGLFADALLARGMDFKYGQFTIFAPSDELLHVDKLVLLDAGYPESAVNDIVLYHVSAEAMTASVTDRKNCGHSLLMLNDEVVNQERSVTYCQEGHTFQIGPGNVDLETHPPQIIGEPVRACDAVIYTIDGSLMLPTLPNITAPVPTEPQTPPPRQTDPAEAPSEPPVANASPVEVPAPTAAPPTQDPDSAMILSVRNSLALATVAGLVVSLF